MLDVFRTADHAGQIFIPHRLAAKLEFSRPASRLSPNRGRLSRRLRGLRIPVSSVGYSVRLCRPLKPKKPKNLNGFLKNLRFLPALTLTHLIIHLLHLNNTHLNGYSVPSWYSDSLWKSPLIRRSLRE